MVLRTSLICGLIALAMMSVTRPAAAQQGYEFGLRFDAVNFRPVSFGGFSFQQTSFRPVNRQPIPFERITFPSLNSRAVRGEAARRGAADLEIVPVPDTAGGRRLRLAVSGRTDAFLASRGGRSAGERARLVLDERSIARGGGNSPAASQISRLSRNADSSSMAQTLLRSRVAVIDGGTEPARLSTVRREVLAGRGEDARGIR